MHICRISKGFLPRRDGWSAHAYYLSVYQALLGDRVVVLQPYWPSEQRCRLIIQQLNVGLFSRHLDWKLSTVALCLRALPVFQDYNRRDRFDVLHLHGDVIDVAMLAPWARRLRIPIVLTLHGGLNRRAVYRVIARRIFPLVNGFIGTSRAVCSDLLALGIDPLRITVISSGVDAELFAPPTPEARRQARRLLDIRDNERVVVSVGRLHPMKGYPELVNAVAKLRFLSSLRVLIVGDGPARKALERQAEDLPMVRFLGGVSREEVPRYLHAADLFVLPSVDLPGTTETTPTALLEAMACGLPVVCTDSGGMSDIVRDGENGYVVPQSEPNALAGAIAKLLANEDLRRRLADRNTAQAQQRTWPAVAGQVTAFCRRVICTSIGY